MLSRIALFVLYFTVCQCSEETPQVKTTFGKIRGVIKKSFTDKNYAAFEGIPYAKPPIGDRRFEAPEPLEPWLGVLDTTASTKCAQTDMIQTQAVQGEEDCLHINVYVPGDKPNPDSNLDVIVHIHGGAYMYFSGDTYANPDYIVDRNVIFVTFNYRLGILGFLSTEDDVIPGNNGLKDQVLALKWVQKHIARFGGNPNSVTITGMSAGGSSVHLHYFSEMSKGLFHRGYSQSGVALNAFSLQEGAAEKARILAQSVGCPIKDTELMVKCLKQRPYKTLLKQIKQFFGYLFLPFSPFAPVVEKGSKPFLKENPYTLLQKGQISDVPWLASNTIHEGLFPALFFQEDLNMINNKWEELAHILLDYNYTLPASAWKSTAEKIKNFYLGEDEDIDQDNFAKFAKIFSDRVFVVDAENSVRLQAKVNKSPVYYYIFGYPGDYNAEKYVMHGADGKYMFGNMHGGLSMTDNEIKVKDIVLDMLISFAKTGVPKIEGVDWKPTNHDVLSFVNITGYDEIKFETVEELAPRSFWKSLNILENENLVVVKDEL